MSTWKRLANLPPKNGSLWQGVEWHTSFEVTPTHKADVHLFYHPHQIGGGWSLDGHQTFTLQCGYADFKHEVRVARSIDGLSTETLRQVQKSFVEEILKRIEEFRGKLLRLEAMLATVPIDPPSV